jgi:AcrR family transcriptional regulator
VLAIGAAPGNFRDVAERNAEPEPLTPRREQTRRKLIDAAMDVFAERGFHRASVDDVARAAGFSIGALYANFGGKEELLLAIFDEHMRWLELVLDEEPPATIDPSDWAGAIDDWPRQFRIFAEFWAYAVREEALREELVDRMRHVRRQLANALERTAAKSGRELPMAPDRLAVVAIAMIRGLAFERIADPDAVPDDLVGWVLERLSA